MQKIQISIVSLMYVKKRNCLRTQSLKILVSFKFCRTFAPEIKPKRLAEAATRITCRQLIQDNIFRITRSRVSLSEG